MAKIRRNIFLYCIHLFGQPLTRVGDVATPHNKVSSTSNSNNYT